jgi:excinuclease ABC subunit C
VVTKPPTGTIPETPGSYQFRDANGKVIYVGKAANLRQRLSNYFQDPRILHTRTAAIVTVGVDVLLQEVAIQA